MRRVAVFGTFDDLKSADVRFLEEAAKLGEVTAVIRDDDGVRARTGKPPKFPAEERRYVVGALRSVGRAVIAPAQQESGDFPFDVLSLEIAAGASPEMTPDIRAVREKVDRPEIRELYRPRGGKVVLIPDDSLLGFPGPPPFLAASDLPAPPDISRKKAIVTGCYDWLHSGHVRFFEEASAYGDLYVDVGSDANIRLLKGEGHPLFPQAERLYMVRAVRFVCRAFIGTGTGWMDAAPEIEIIRPDYYVVNEDGDRPEKREFCAARGIKYVVLRRLPARGLPPRDSTTLRGF